MPIISSAQILRRHASPFAISALSLTAVLIANYAARALPRLSARGASAGTIAEALLLAVPFTAALAIPMAVFIAVLWVFTRLGKEGVVTSASSERHGVRRLVTPVLAAAAGIAAFLVVWNAQVLPRANSRLEAVLTSNPAPVQNARTMTFGELRAAAGKIRSDARANAPIKAAVYEMEAQKKIALAAACVALALAAAAAGLRFPRAGIPLVVVMSLAVLGGYYAVIVAGESLANRLGVSPFVGMWTANAVLLAAALLALRFGGSLGTPQTGQAMAGGTSPAEDEGTTTPLAFSPLPRAMG